MRPFHAEEQRIPKTEEWLAENPVCCEIVSEKLLQNQQKRTVNFKIFYEL
jgi:hypothetical protein